MTGAIKYRVRGFLFLMLVIYESSAWANFALTPYIGDFNRSRAGGAAAAEDATTVYTNPAGLSRLSGQHFSGVAQYYMTSAMFTDQGSRDAFGAALEGSDSDNGGVNTAVPAMYYSKQFSSQWVFGVGLNAPFGLSTQYDRQWVGRYTSVETAIMSLNINPSLAYKLNKEWSVGMGLNLQRTQATLSRAIDFAAVCLAYFAPNVCASMGMPAPQSADGFVEMKADDWGTGYNLGVLWSTNATRAGFSYRSKVSYELQGEADFTVPAQAAAFQSAFADTGVTIPLTLPEIISLSIHHDWTEKFAIMADITHTRWSRLKQLEFNFDDPTQAQQIKNKNWRDTQRYSLGFNYKIHPAWALQWGVAYEKSPIPEQTYDPSIPVGDILWFNVGTQYQLSRDLSLEMGLAHVHIKKRQVSQSGDFGETLHGDTTTRLEVINTRLNWSF